MKVYQDGGIGFLTDNARKRKRSAAGLVRNASRGDIRLNFTFVAVLCDDEEVQKRLPQFIVLSDTVLSSTLHAELLAALPSNIVLWRCKSSWMNAGLVEQMLRELGKVKRSLGQEYAFVVHADAFRAHMTPKVWRTAALHGLLYFLIPSKLTWVLQVCDAHLFAYLKHKLKEACQRHNVISAAGKPDLASVVKNLCEVWNGAVLSKGWKKAFRDLGMIEQQTHLSARVLAKLELSSTPAVCRSMPTLEDLQLVWPRGASIPIQQVFAGPLKFIRLSEASHDAAVIPVQAVVPSTRLVRIGHGMPSSSSLQVSSAVPGSPPHQPSPLDPAAACRPVLRLSSRSRLPSMVGVVQQPPLKPEDSATPST